MSCTIRSIGIIVIDPTAADPRIVLLEHPVSYATGCLIGGRKYYGTSHLTLDFANSMTAAEKLDCLNDTALTKYPFFLESLKKCYSKLLAQMEQKRQDSFIQRRLREYMKTLHILRPLIRNSTRDGVRPWSFPKGRSNDGECRLYPTTKDFEIGVAVRELIEETKVDPDSFNVHNYIAPFNISYTDMGVQYEFVLYYATPKDNFAFHIDPHDIYQVNEVSDIRWVTKDELAGMPLCKITRTHVLDNFDNIVTHFMTHWKPNHVGSVIPPSSTTNFQHSAFGPTNTAVQVVAPPPAYITGGPANPITQNISSMYTHTSQASSYSTYNPYSSQFLPQFPPQVPPQFPPQVSQVPHFPPQFPLDNIFSDPTINYTHYSPLPQTNIFSQPPTFDGSFSYGPYMY